MKEKECVYKRERQIGREIVDGGRENEVLEREREKTKKRGERRFESVRMSKRDRRGDEV